MMQVKMKQLMLQKPLLLTNLLRNYQKDMKQYGDLGNFFGGQKQRFSLLNSKIELILDEQPQL